MITKERLEELIEQGATVYEIVYNYNGDIFCEYDLKNLPTYHKNNLEHFLYLHTVFETLEEAEWHKEFGCIERTERLELPTWEEFNEMSSFIFENKDGIMLEMAIWYCDREDLQIKTIKITNHNDWNIRLFEKPLTKENYTLACRKCKELFLGGSDE